MRMTTGIFAGVMVVALTLLTLPAHAILIQFDLGNHPNGSVSLNPNAVDAKDYGLRLDTPSAVNTFSFQDVKFLVNTDTGNGTIFGTVKHLQSSDIWKINSNLSGITSLGSFNGGQPVPYDDMFDDLLNASIIGYSNSIIYNDNTLSLSAVGAVTPGTGYTGPLNWVSKGLPPGDPYAGQELLLSYRHRLDPNVFSGTEWNLLTGAGWWQPVGANFNATDDFLFVMRNPQQVVPEPTTMALLGTGFLGSLFARRRKTA